MRTIGSVVRDLRRGRGWSLRDVETHAGGRLTYGAVAGIEQGRVRDVKLSTLRALASAFGVSTAELVTMMEARNDRRHERRIWRTTYVVTRPSKTV